ncbi:DUF4252 domain-containing protein [Urechidicola croceus]|uniref:DUF4252 domain-containing protein n=1 Tax=Urechidicola croceus TaxID=1850246 RepID=A0A1D8P5J6_9FLAO|nr:DUF4252 domain-containing protein [Urechidicola croceus]AOW19839.1 hypothetical protein LPB138_03680 [Urechidicola croceus]
MKRFIKYFGILVIMAMFTISCNQHPSLQKYYVDSQENTDFIALDIPASILKLKQEDVSKEEIEALNSIKKVNFLGFQLNENNLIEYNEEKLKVKEILKNPKYQELISVGGKQSLSVKYLGEDNAIDEVIIYGSDKEMGFALVRILGDKMDPSKMMNLIGKINMEGDNNSLKQIETFMKNMK